MGPSPRRQSPWRAGSCRCPVSRHQDAARNLAAQFLELARIAQEVDQLLDLFLGFFNACDVVEGDAHLVFAQHPCTALAKGQRAAAAAAALHLAHQVYPHRNEEQEGEPGDKNLHQQALSGRCLGFDANLVVQKQPDQRSIVGFRAVGEQVRPILQLQLDRGAVQGDLGHLSAFDGRDEVRVVERSGDAVTRREILEHQHENQCYHRPQRKVACHRLLFLLRVVSGAQTGPRFTASPAEPTIAEIRLPPRRTPATGYGKPPACGATGWQTTCVPPG